jgi:8-oxo-(d)GTP phosphatase
MANHKPAPKDSRLIKAAGGVAWRPGPGGEPEILLVHRKKYDDWSLPKGKMEPGEPLPVTAVREVLEEGGARLALGRRLISVRYNVGGRPKRVHYWAARVLSVDAHAVPNSEVDEIAWVPASSAVDKVSYSHDHGVLADFAVQPVNTVPLILLRHAKALSKSGWKRADILRPLDDSGRSEAKALADLLACFAPGGRLISSPAMRCLETLRPFAHLSGGEVEEEPSLFIHYEPSGTGAADPHSDAQTLVRQAIATGRPTVICAHRENIPKLQAAALAALTAPGSVRPPAREWDAALPTASFWVLNIAAPETGQLVATPAAVPATAAQLVTDPLVAAPPLAGQEAPDQEAPDQEAPDQEAVAPPATGHRRWLRIPGRISRRPFRPPAPPAADTAQTSGAVVEGSGAAGPPAVIPGEEPKRPANLLISADRYDLAES